MKRTRTNKKIRVEEKREGARNEISTSKTRNRIASKKNFIQKGTWDEPKGSKPHSKGERESKGRGENKQRKEEENKMTEKTKTDQK